MGARALLSRLRSFVGARTDPAREVIARKDHRIAQLRARLERSDKELAALRTRLAEDGAENIVWIFCTARSGSTWLASMMGDLEGHAMWDEPLVGALFGEFYYQRAAHKRGAKAILGQPYRDVWLGSIRRMVLEGARARYPEALEGGCVVIKEPHGSMGAPLLMEALPESRMVLLVRDPRDVISSAIDAQRKGSWTSKNKRWAGKKPETKADTDPDVFARERAETYVRSIEKARDAYESHGGRKVLVRYEELRADTLGTMQRIYASLEIPTGEDLARSVEKHAWEGIPEEEKGEGKFYRKATPGGWREDLTQEQAEMVEEVTAPLLDEFYPGWRDEASPRGGRTVGRSR